MFMSEHRLSVAPSCFTGATRSVDSPDSSQVPSNESAPEQEGRRQLLRWEGWVLGWPGAAPPIATDEGTTPLSAPLPNGTSHVARHINHRGSRGESSASLLLSASPLFSKHPLPLPQSSSSNRHHVKRLHRARDAPCRRIQTAHRTVSAMSFGHPLPPPDIF